ncbi:MAG: 16S rRNA (guanine(966)-N(2))-methyltransferase RsmD [Clostridia bacterium]
MRIISGKYRGKTLKTLEGMDTRPTTSRVKESVFNIIQFNIPDSNVLDLFAGSGQMGIECLSRGAISVDFCDQNSKAVSIIKNNLKICNENQKVSQNDYISFIKSCNKKYDIIYLDPPYSTEMINNSINLINRFKLLKECGIIVCETHIDDKIDLSSTDFTIQKTYKYGTINITLIKEI